MLKPSTRCYRPGRFGNVGAASLDSPKSGGILGSCSLPPSGLAWLLCACSWLLISPMRFANFLNANQPLKEQGLKSVL